MERLPGTNERVVAPLELQYAWLCQTWGIETLGSNPNFSLVNRMNKCLVIFNAFSREIKDRTANDWEVIRGVLAIVEEWTSG